MDADVFGIGDYLQFVRKHAYIMPDGTKESGKSYQAHSPIKTAQGEFLLSIPARGKLLPISQTAIDYTKHWAFKHLENIKLSYGGSSQFSRFFSEIEAILSPTYTNLAELTMRTVYWGLIRLLSDEKITYSNLNIDYVNELLRIKHPFRLKKIFIDSQAVPLAGKGKANEWIISLCRYAQVDEYLYGGSSHAAYMDLDLFEQAGIKPVLQQWTCVPYHQKFYGLGFLPNLSIIDLVMNESLEVRQRIILGR